MNAFAPATQGCPADAEKAARSERRLRMLGELAEIGMALAQAVGRQALREAAGELGRAATGGPGADLIPPALPPSDGSEPPAGRRQAGAAPDWGLAFSRIARGVRQTIALQARLDADPAAPGPGRLRERPRGRISDPRKSRIRRLAREAAEGCADGRDFEALCLDIDERLDDEEIDAALARGTPIGVLANSICCGLGLDLDLSQFMDDELGFPLATPDRSGGIRPARPAGDMGPARPAGDMGPARPAGGMGPPRPASGIEPAGSGNEIRPPRPASGRDPP